MWAFILAVIASAAVSIAPSTARAFAGAPPDDGARGVFFSKKTYVPEAIPTFEESKTALPVPIVDDHPDWVNLYWAAWQMAFQHFKAPPDGSPLVSDYLDSAFSSHLFQWDTIFMIPFMSYADAVFPAIESLDNFYARQHDNGYIDREIDAATGEDYVYYEFNDTINPPLFAWVEEEHAIRTGDTSRYAEVYEPLVEYAQYLESARKALNSKHQLYWNRGLGSGMDNAPRGGTGWVDMSSQMVLMYRSLSDIAFTLGKTADGAEFSRRADEIAQRIESFMWDDQDGLFYDVDDNGAFVKHKTMACFWPMLARVATPYQVSRMVQNLEDPRQFWREDVWPSLAADQPEFKEDGNYWRGGVWAPTNAMITDGLRLYPNVAGTQDLIVKASEKYLRNMSEVYQKTGTIWELYRPDEAAPGTKWWFMGAHRDFVGWSGIGPIQFLIENILGIHVDALAQKITWRIDSTAHHGIRNLRVGDQIVSLEVAPRSHDEDPITVQTELRGRETLALDIVWNGVHYPRRLTPGTGDFLLKPMGR